MLKGLKLRLYPNKIQQGQLEQMFGNTRFVWNQMLAMMQKRKCQWKNGILLMKTLNGTNKQ